MTALAQVIDLTARRDRVVGLVEQWRPLALGIARRMVGHTDQWPAVESAALFGLWQAARTFDDRPGVQFGTWLDHKVRSAVRDEMRRLDHQSRYWREKLSEAERVEDDLTASMRRHPTSAEVNAIAGIDREDARLIHQQTALGHPLSLDHLVSAGLELHDVVAAPEPNDEAQELELLIHATLHGRQLGAVLRYLDGETLAQIGISWGCTESNVCHHMRKAKQRLREAARQAGLIEGGDAA